MSIFHFFQRLCQRGFKSKKANRNEELSNMLPKLVVKESYTYGVVMQLEALVGPKLCSWRELN